MALTASALAAGIHRKMVQDDRFGYSWAERHGAYADTFTIDGQMVTIQVGDYDCSSSTITAWTLALFAFGLGDVLSGATYTGNMKWVFLRSGLFEWRTDFANAKPGDLYLDEDQHVAMCQGDNILSEFSSNEFGGAYGGMRGDQTGWEAHITGFYRGSWDGYLHYIGNLKAIDGGLIVATKQEIDAIAAAVNSYTWGSEDRKKNRNVYNCLQWTLTYVEQMTKKVNSVEKKIAEQDKKLDKILAKIG